MPEHKKHGVKCNQKLRIRFKLVGFSKSLAQTNNVRTSNKCQQLRFKDFKKGGNKSFNFVSLFKFWFQWQKQHLLSKRNLKEKKTYTQGVTQLHERMPNSATLFSEPRKWSNLMTVSVWGRDRAYKRESDRPFYNRCFYRGESTLHWAVSHMRDTRKLWKQSWKCMFTGKNASPPIRTTHHWIFKACSKTQRGINT